MNENQVYYKKKTACKAGKKFLPLILIHTLYLIGISLYFFIFQRTFNDFYKRIFCTDQTCLKCFFRFWLFRPLLRHLCTSFRDRKQLQFSMIRRFILLFNFFLAGKTKFGRLSNHDCQYPYEDAIMYQIE